MHASSSPPLALGGQPGVRHGGHRYPWAGRRWGDM